jgi:hypothetical protein
MNNSKQPTTSEKTPESVRVARSALVPAAVVCRGQWKCGHLQPDVYAKVTDPNFVQQDLKRWEDAGEALLNERKQALTQFLATLTAPLARPPE